MARVVSQAELSRIAGVSRTSIAKACRGKLKKARKGDGVDLDHPLVAEYLASHDREAPAAVSPAGVSRPKPTAPRRREAVPTARPAASPGASGYVAALQSGSAPTSPEDIEDYADMTLREIAERFGSISAHKDWLEMRKKQVDIREKELKNEELSGRLIPRDGVATHVFGAIGSVQRRLLQDAPKTIARRLFAMARSGATVEDAERTVTEVLSSQLRPVKDQAARALRNMAANARGDDANDGADG